MWVLTQHWQPSYSSRHVSNNGQKDNWSLLGDCHPQRDIPRFVNLWKSGKLDLDGMISHRIALDEINLGFENVRNKRNTNSCRGSFNMTTSSEELLDLTGKVAIVTGGSAG